MTDSQSSEAVSPPNRMATTALVLGIIALFIALWTIVPLLGLIAAWLGMAPTVLTIVFGHAGLARSRISGVGRTKAIVGLVFGYISLALVLGMTIFWVIFASAVPGFA